MDRAIFISFSLLLLIGIGYALYRLSPPQPSSNTEPKREYELQKLVHQAAGVMKNLGDSPNGAIEDYDVLSARSRNNVARWLDLYETVNWEKRELSA